ncbi:Uncharacterised protein [uncultured Ruminococcus sp.]|uniref:Uncharacterized protein n=1 Tax=Massiliimalia timonensis TaxID=1987501 RepID=A0A8J6P4T4_9FIRM|nr:hypothetical protein [Massiliimalia timonensis]MBC8609539.1 hypothetical protein [Massiliimalia timonensis]MBS7174689.1 hypothetical protein [Clostridiales bacterium]SCH38735.1 Uncharacterised protein [uncultured Ruminococcus sp.]SCH40415.1 Uncharacterised protein [uncultured Clostridium sp.]
MKSFPRSTYSEKIRRRIRLSWTIIVVMLIYMVVVVELGGGDSRIMSDFATAASRIIFFGGLIYLVSRICYHKKLLKNRQLLKDHLRAEQDERNQYLHDKSGGTVLDVLLICLLFMTFTAALFDMAAFYTAVSVLALAVLLKLVFYYIASHT